MSIGVRLTLFSALALGMVLSASGVDSADFNAVLERGWKQQKLTAVPPAPDEVFLRRAYLTLSGKLPASRRVRDFLRDRSPDKRKKLIDELLDSPAFAELTAMRYAQMFRVKSEFPINLWPNAVQLFHRYLRDAAAEDMPFDAMARELLTSSGSNFRTPQVNFIRGNADRSPRGVARGTALALLGIRLEKLDNRTAEGMAAFFSRIGRKNTDEWKEELIFTLPEPAVIEARTPTGEKFRIAAPVIDPRAVFADWLTAPENPYFARAVANRAWHWVFGRGLVDPADDLSGECSSADRYLVRFGAAANYPPRTTPELDALAASFRAGGCSVKNLFRVICASPAFGADWKTVSAEQARAEAAFAVYPVRRLEPELLVDALGDVTGSRDRYRSVIPEPFTFLPAGYPAVRIADGSISDGVLDRFGRSPRDSGRLDEVKTSITAEQRLWLLNSSVLYDRISRAPRMIFGGRKLSRRERVDEIYLRILSRYPTADERTAINRYDASGSKQLWADLIWVLVNSREFILHH